MVHSHNRILETTTLAIGIKGRLDSFCGAIERFQRLGKQWNGLLSLKEQCARRLALIKNEQLKCYIYGSLPSNLFKYVTKDIFNLKRQEFLSNYREGDDLCDECSFVSRRKRGKKRCDCPRLKVAIRKLNEYFFKGIDFENRIEANKSKRFDLIYKIPDDECGASDEPFSYFLYLAPCENRHDYDSNARNHDIDFDEYLSSQSYGLIKSQAAIEEKFLFIDVMRFFGGFHSEYEQPELILCHRMAVHR